MARVRGLGELNWRLHPPDADLHVCERFPGGDKASHFEMDFEVQLTLDEQVVRMLDPQIYAEVGEITSSGFMPHEVDRTLSDLLEDRSVSVSESCLPARLQHLLVRFSRKYQCQESSGYTVIFPERVIWLEVSKAKTGTIRNPDRFLHALARNLSKWFREDPSDN